jgi:LmbE family N-acetylglucosaminyl deacetylase
MHPVLADLLTQGNSAIALGAVRCPLILAAHPDDEIIGASAILGRVPGCTVAFLTDGAPHDSRLRSPHVNGSREHYARVRAQEAADALTLAGVREAGIVWLGGTDQQAIYHWNLLLRSLISVLRRFKPEVVIIHPYEGGHPDHDAAALITYLATHSVGGATLPVLEMTSYHASSGCLRFGEFCSQSEAKHDDVLTIRLTAEERERKCCMLNCYRSQAEVLAAVPLELERFRLAPAYDFTGPPHGGQLWYEMLGWPMTGARWRAVAAAALQYSSEAR